MAVSFKKVFAVMLLVSAAQVPPAFAADPECAGKINGYFWASTALSAAPPTCASPLTGKQTCKQTFSNYCFGGNHLAIKIIESCSTSSCKTTTAATTPVVTKPVTTPIVTKPVTTPVITKPVTTPVVTTPVITKPVVTTPVVTTPVITKPVTTPVVVTTDPRVNNPAPVVTTPVVTTPVVTKPVVTTPVVTTPVVTTPVVTKPVTTPVVTTPVVTTPVVTKPVTTPVVTTPVVTTPVVTKPVTTPVVVTSPVVTPAPVNMGIVWGTNGHPLTKNANVFKDDRVLDVMAARGIRSYRVDVNLASDTDPYIAHDFNALYEKARAKGITLKPALAVPFTWGDRTDGGRYPKGDRAALYNQGFKRTFDFVNQFKGKVNDWELENELNLLARDPAGGMLFGKGWAASEFDTPIMNDWAAVLQGMSDAIDQINNTNGLHLRKVVNTTSTMFGFLDFMEAKGVKFDVVAYHYYEPGNVNPHSYWGGVRPQYDLFKKLASYNKPVFINEINCQEIYRGGFENKLGQPLTNACFQSLNTVLRYFTTQTDANIEEINLYEILDEPAKGPVEGSFGIMYDINTPKLTMSIISKYNGSALTSTERAALARLGIN